MATLIEVRQAIKATLQNNITGLNVTNVLGMPVPPAVMIVPQPWDYLYVFRNKTTEFEFVLDVFAAPAASEQFGQDTLDALVDGDGERSIVGCLLSNSTLGRSDCSVGGPIRLTHYGTITAGDTAFVGARISFAVIATRA